MTRFMLRRLLIIPIALLLINFAGFSYAHVVRPLRAARTPFFFGPLPQSAPLFPAYSDYLEGGFGLNDPMPQGVAGGRSVAQALGQACRASLGLLGLATALSILLGLALGMLAVRGGSGRVSRWLTFLSSAGLAMPSFYVGSLLILGSLAFVLWGRPGTHAPLPVQGFGWDLHLLIPTLALMARPTVEIAQVTAGLLETELEKRYILTAQSLGHPRHVVRWRHALRNTLAPLILSIAASLRRLMGGLLLVEWLLKWPGIGYLLSLSLIPKQLNIEQMSPEFLFPPIVAGLLTVFGALFLLTDLLSAVLVRVVDPRLRAPEEGTGSADVVVYGAGLARRNWPLVIGLLLVLLVATISIAGPAMAPHDPVEENTIVQTADGWETAPFPALTVPGYPLGTDRFGRDLLSRLLWAVRPTIAMVAAVAVVRLAVGILIGMVAGWSEGPLGRVLDTAITAALSLPVLLVALITIAAVGIEIGLPAFIAGLALTGWGETARIVREQTRIVKGQLYVEAARAFGAPDRVILLRHVLRQITPMVWMLSAFEISATLTTTAGLGFLGYYIGGDVWVDEMQMFVARRISGMPEMGQMLASAGTAVEILANPWIMIALGTLVFLTVLGFNLLGEGLRRRLQPRTGREPLLSRIARPTGTWARDRMLIPVVRWARRRIFLSAVLALVLVVVSTGLVWWGTRARVPEVVLEVPGGHLWAAARRDPWGTLWTEATGPTAPKELWVFEDSSGFVAGPAVAVDGTVYIAAAGGTLHALDAAGSVRWQASLPAEPVGVPALSADGHVYVMDKEGGLSSFAADGAFRWRVRPGDEDVAVSGPVVAADGTIYFPLRSSLHAVSPDGVSLWETTVPFDYRVAPLRTSPDGDLLFWERVVVGTVDGSQRTFELQVDVDEYIVGADGQMYVRLGASMAQWRPSNTDKGIVLGTVWGYDGGGALYGYVPDDVGATPEGAVWLLTSMWRGTTIAWLDEGGREMGAVSLPGLMVPIAVDRQGTIYACTPGRPWDEDAPTVSCLAVAIDSKDPLWRVQLGKGKALRGGALVPDRLYIATEEGYLYALGDPE